MLDGNIFREKSVQIRVQVRWRVRVIGFAYFCSNRSANSCSRPLNSGGGSSETGVETDPNLDGPVQGQEIGSKIFLVR